MTPELADGIFANAIGCLPKVKITCFKQFIALYVDAPCVDSFSASQLTDMWKSSRLMLT